MQTKGRRAIRAGAALLFGYSATWIAFNASSSASSEGKRGTLLGALDFAELCRVEHGARAEAIHLRLDAYGWRCFFTEETQYQQREIDIEHACDTLFEGEVYSESFDLTSGTSWQCFRGPRP